MVVDPSYRAANNFQCRMQPFRISVCGDFGWNRLMKKPVAMQAAVMNFRSQITCNSSSRPANASSE
jgi:hypothetical protein